MLLTTELMAYRMRYGNSDVGDCVSWHLLLPPSRSARGSKSAAAGTPARSTSSPSHPPQKRSESGVSAAQQSNTGTTYRYTQSSSTLTALAPWARRCAAMYTGVAASETCQTMKSRHYIWISTYTQAIHGSRMYLQKKLKIMMMIAIYYQSYITPYRTRKVLTDEGGLPKKKIRREEILK